MKFSIQPRFAVPIMVIGMCISAQCGPIWQDTLVLNEAIKPVYFEHLSYPLTARLTRVQGIVVVRVKLDDGGNVVSSAAISGAKILISDCLLNSRKWRFQPNADKAAVIVYHFKIEGLCNLPCPSQFHVEPPNLAIITMGDPVVDHLGK